MALLTRRAGLVGAAATVLAVLAARKFQRWSRVAALAPGTVELRPLNAIVPISPPSVLAPFTLHTVSGATRTMADYAGQMVVMNFWATWCSPCVAELPELDRLAAEGGFTVLAVSADRGGASVAGPFAAAHGLTHATLLLDPGNDAVHALGVEGFPTTLIVGPEGRLRGTLEGPAPWGEAGPAIRKLAANPA